MNMKQKSMNKNGNWVLRLVVAAVCLQCSLLNASFSVCSAQPKKSRVQQTQQKQQGTRPSASSGMTRRMQISYPVALDMPEDVVWRRDIYRELNLEEEANAGLYYPAQPQGRQMNLFTYIFKLAQNNYIPIYEYSATNDGNDDFSETAKVDMKTVLQDHGIHFTEEDGKLKVENNHIPSEEVTKYYLKESAYYDQTNATFRIKVIALCPIMEDKDFGGEPLFWVKYSDLEPFLSRQTIMTSNVNNAAVMSMDDYFTQNKYKGSIYKTNNMLGKTLAQMVGEDSVSLSAEQRRIEAELEAFRKHIYGDPAKRDSLDSLAANYPQNLKVAQKKSRQQSSAASTRTKTERASRSKSSASSSSAPAARVTVRRQRH